MAKSFYTAQEAAAELGTTEEGLKDLVREGKLREFRDGGKVNYKATDIDKIKASAGPIPPPGDVDVSGESGEILLEPAEEESGIELAPSGSDVLSLEGSDMLDGTSSSTASGTATNEGSAIASVGTSVFDDDLGEDADPLAQTAVSDIAGLGLEGMGSGSGILDLTRESDDTSLGAELLEEIYTGDDAGEGKAESGIAAVADDTRAGMEGVLEEAPFEVETEKVTVSSATGAARQVVEYAPDAISSGLTAGMAVAVAIMLVGALASVSLVQGTMPGLLSTVYAHLLYFAGGGLLVVLLAVAVSYLMAKRSR